MDDSQRQILKRFAHDEPLVVAVQDALMDFFLKPSGSDIHILAAEKIILNRLPVAFTAIKQMAIERSETGDRSQVGL